MLAGRAQWASTRLSAQRSSDQELGKRLTRRGSHTMLLSCRHVSEENFLLAYLDLTGTKRFYENSELPEQINRISQVVGAVHAEIDNTFGEDKTNLFVHMYADSLVIAQKNLIEGCVRKLVELMLKVQYQVLMDSQLNKVKAKDSERVN